MYKVTYTRFPHSFLREANEFIFRYAVFTFECLSATLTGKLHT